jgi:transposase-like protein
MMADRGITLMHTTVLRWVQCYLPEFERRWSRYARPVGGYWRTDETYIKVGGRWVYLYRAVDKAGGTVGFFLRRNRDVNAAKAFLRHAMRNTRQPTKITLEAYAASHRAVREMKETGELPTRVMVRSSQYLNNLIDQDHRRVKQRVRPMPARFSLGSSFARAGAGMGSPPAITVAQAVLACAEFNATVFRARRVVGGPEHSRVRDQCGCFSDRPRAPSCRGSCSCRSSPLFRS